MKRLVITLAAALTCFAGSAQNVKYGGWNEQIVVGANVSLNSTWIFNKAVQSLDDGVSDQRFSFGWTAGGSFAFRFNELIAVGLDLQYFGYQQKYEGALATQSQFWESATKLNGLNIPVYAKIMGRSGVFVEIGWQFGVLLAARHSRSSAMGGVFTENENVSEHFGSAIFSPHLGFGFDFMLSDELMMTFGLRANYGVNDIKGIDGLGNPVAEYPNTNPSTPISPSDTGPAPSNVFTAGLFIGVRYAFDAGGRY